jgi:hypothetical protein
MGNQKQLFKEQTTTEGRGNKIQKTKDTTKTEVTRDLWKGK